MELHLSLRLSITMMNPMLAASTLQKSNQHQRPGETRGFWEIPSAEHILQLLWHLRLMYKQ